MKRFARAAFVALALPASVAACAALLDIEELPQRPDQDAAPLDASAPEPDGGSACDGGGRLCACTKHDFCDDFDDDAAVLGASWSGFGGLGNPFLKGDSGMNFTGTAFSAPRALESFASAQSTSAFAVLGHQLDQARLHPGRPFGGVRMSVLVQIGALSFSEIRGPLPDGGSAVAAAVVNFVGANLGGAAVVVGLDGAYLFSSVNLLEGNRKDAGPDDVVVQLFDGDVTAIARNWLRVEIVVADRAVALREGYSTCASVPAGPVMAAVVGPTALRQGCAAVPASLGGLSWASTPILTVGGALFGGGELVFRQDDVTMDFLEP